MSVVACPSMAGLALRFTLLRRFAILTLYLGKVSWAADGEIQRIFRSRGSHENLGDSYIGSGLS